MTVRSTAPQGAANRPTDAVDGVGKRRAANVLSNHRFLIARQAGLDVEVFVWPFPNHAPHFVSFLGHVQNLKA